MAYASPKKGERNKEIFKKAQKINKLLKGFYDMKKKCKKAQFYLVTTIMIVAIIVGFASLSNFSQKRSSLKFYYDGEELRIESGEVIDYGIKQDFTNEEMIELMLNFTQDYINFSEADNFYFIVGDETNISFAGYQKSKTTSVTIITASGETIISMSEERKYVTQNFDDPPGPGNSINLTISGNGDGNLKFEFNLNEGSNFYYVVSKEIGGDRYLETNA